MEVIRKEDCIENNHPLRWVKRKERDKRCRRKTMKRRIDEWVKNVQL